MVYNCFQNNSMLIIVYKSYREFKPSQAVIIFIIKTYGTNRF